ncbi:MAG: threonine synthase [Enterovirga sp.]|nr:threonine synthase [Enterovirga sp.]
MLHISTRGEAPSLSFTDALLAGLARDGGLYVPETWPALAPETIAGFAGRPYREVAKTVLGTLTGNDIAPAVLGPMVDGAYAEFRHPAVCPLVQIGDNLFVQELFHGPTLAFKDVAMQLLGRLMDHVLASRGQRATIVGATSGDTGSAAVAAFAGSPRVDIFILYPHGRVSEVQRRQMTTVDAPNVHAIAIDGTFDDAQALVKEMFGDGRFRDEMQLSGINSINWARVAAQAVYYFTAAVALGGPSRPVSFAVPTGNFGDVLAGFVAKQMGLPIDRLLVATNANDILARTLATGSYEVRGVVPTTSPSMDIQVSSNFERLLFEAHGRDPAALRGLMGNLAQSRSFAIAPEPLAAIRRDFEAGSVDEGEVADEIGRTWREAGYLLDPHTAIGVRAARRRLATDAATPVVALATAHPAKFPEAVEKAAGIRPPLPPHLADLLGRGERLTRLANDPAEIKRFIRSRARSVGGRAA